VKATEVHPAFRCSACGKVLTDGLTIHGLHCPKGGGRFERVGVAVVEEAG
jgi:hypothetical protein